MVFTNCSLFSNHDFGLLLLDEIADGGVEVDDHCFSAASVVNYVLFFNYLAPRGCLTHFSTLGIGSLLNCCNQALTVSDYNTPYEVSLDIHDVLSGFVTRKSGVLSFLFQYAEPETSPSISVEALQVWICLTPCLVPNQISFS